MRQLTEHDLEAFARDAEGVRDALHQLLAPFGWNVSYTLEAPGPVTAAAYRYRATMTVNCRDSLFHGRVLDHTFVIDLRAWFLGGPRWVREQPVRWAQQLMARALDHLHHPPLPTAPTVDWRPTGAVPEDFYTA